MALVASAGSPAGAYWTVSSSGTGTATTGTLTSPVDVTTAPAAGSEVDISWASGPGGVAPAGYYLTRHTAAAANSPATVEPACATAPTQLTPGFSCTDAPVPDGDHTYVVVAVSAHGSWTAPSAPSEVVSVRTASVLAFDTEPSDVTVDTPITPPVTVSLRTASDQPVATAGVPVTIAVAENPADGTLAGVTTRDTDVEGRVSFAGLSLDRPSRGYTLVATSPGLTAATSTEFAVTAPPLLGAARTFSVLAGTAVVNTGVSSISGDVGVSPGTAISGLGPHDVGGELHAGGVEAAHAQEATALAYAELAARPVPAENELVGDLGGRTLGPGVYHSTAALALTGVLTLDAQQDPDATFVFQADAAFDTAAGARIQLVGGAKAANVFWVVAGAAGAGAASQLAGTILSHGAITLGAGTALTGRALSTGTVTLAGNSVRFTSDLPPTMTIAGGATRTSKDPTPTISGTTTAPAASPVTVTLEGQVLSTTAAVDGTWAVTASTLAAGVHQVVAKVRAPSGDGASAAQALTVEVNPQPVVLGTAASFSVLASTGVVSTGVTHLSGNLGVSPSASVTGFGPSEGGTLDGSIHAADVVASTARDDLVAALDDASTRLPHTEIAGDLGGRTFHGGVHHITAALALTGAVVLDGEGDPNSVFIFQTDAAFNTSAGSTVVLAGGAQASNVFWIVTGAAGSGANSSLAGSVLARGAITLGAGTTLEGRALSLGTVTLASNTLSQVQ